MLKRNGDLCSLWIPNFPGKYENVLNCSLSSLPISQIYSGHIDDVQKSSVKWLNLLFISRAEREKAIFVNRSKYCWLIHIFPTHDKNSSIVFGHIHRDEESFILLATDISVQEAYIKFLPASLMDKQPKLYLGTPTVADGYANASSFT